MTDCQKCGGGPISGRACTCDWTIQQTPEFHLPAATRPRCHHCDRVIGQPEDRTTDERYPDPWCWCAEGRCANERAPWRDRAIAAEAEVRRLWQTRDEVVREAYQRATLAAVDLCRAGTMHGIPEGAEPARSNLLADAIMEQSEQRKT